MKVEAATDELTIRSYTYRTEHDGTPYRYVKIFPDRPGVVVQGETFEEAYWKGEAVYESLMRRLARSDSTEESDE